MSGRGALSEMTRDDKIDSVLDALREVDRRAGLDDQLAIGELILREFFAGDPKRWRDQRRNKNHSIRRLAERPECPLSKSALSRSVAVYVAVLAMPCVRTWGHIKAGHVAAVLSLSHAERGHILGRAEQEGWSVRRVEQEVVGLRRAEGERRGRPALRESQRALSHLRNATGRLKEALSEPTAPLGAHELQEIRDLARELRAWGTELEAWAGRWRPS